MITMQRFSSPGQPDRVEKCSKAVHRMWPQLPRHFVEGCPGFFNRIML